jgi:hypothetical protein
LLLKIEPNVEPTPPIPPSLFIIILLMYKFIIMNTPKIATNDTGKGISIDNVILMPKDTPIQSN